MDENSQVGTLVSELYSDDPDFPFDNITYSLKNPSNQLAPFKIVGQELIVQNTSLLDFEAAPATSIILIATDSGGLSASSTVSIRITDVNEAPSDIVFARTSVPESIKVGEVATTFAVMDPDNRNSARQQHRCSVDNSAIMPFAVRGSTLVVTGAGLNYERENRIKNVAITCTDTGGPPQSLTKIVDLTVVNVNEAPTDIGMSAYSVPENAPAGTVVGLFTTTDADNEGSEHAQFDFRYALIAPLECARFQASCPFRINGTALLTSRGLDFEHQNEYEIQIRAVDKGGASVTKSFMVHVGDTNDVPDRVVLSSNVVQENVRGDLVGQLTTVDQDIGQSHSYEIVDASQTDAGMFALVGSALHLAPDVQADFERAPVLSVRIRSTDTGAPFPRSVASKFQIRVTNVKEYAQGILIRDEPEQRASRHSVSVAEQFPPGEVFASLLVSMAESTVLSPRAATNVSCTVRQTLWRLEPTADRFEVQNKTGLTISPGTALDYETHGEHSYTIEAMCVYALGRELASVLSNVSVALTNVNEAASVTIAAAGRVIQRKRNATHFVLLVPETTTPGSVVGTVVILDPDNCNTTQCFPWQQHSVLNKDPSAFFRVDSNTIRTTAALDFETGAVHTLQFEISDSASPVRTGTFTVQVRITDVAEPPEFVGLSGNQRVDSSVNTSQTVGDLFVPNNTGVYARDRTFVHYVVSVAGPGGTLLPNASHPFKIRANQLRTVVGVRLLLGTYAVTVQTYQAGATTADATTNIFLVTALRKNVAPTAVILRPETPSVMENTKLDATTRGLATIAVVDGNNAPGCGQEGTCEQRHSCIAVVQGCTAVRTLSCLPSVPGPFFVEYTGNNELQLAANTTTGVFNFESIARYDVGVTCTDNGVPPLSWTTSVNVDVENINDPPKNVQLLTATGKPPAVSEDAADGFVVGVLHCDDEDQGQQHSFAIGGGQSLTP